MQSNDNNTNEYFDVEYLQFNPSKRLQTIQSILGILTWPIVWPLAMITKRSEILFRTVSEFIALIPYFPGVIIRYEYYRFALKSFGKNVLIEFGTVFIYPDIEVGNNVLIGRFNIIHHCDFGDYVLAGERCTFLSGSRQHRFDDASTPIALQGGQKKRIRMNDNCWIGSHCVVMESIESGSIVAAGSVVQKPVEEMSIVGGVPAKLIRKR